MCDMPLAPAQEREVLEHAEHFCAALQERIDLFGDDKAVLSGYLTLAEHIADEILPREH